MFNLQKYKDLPDARKLGVCERAYELLRLNAKQQTPTFTEGEYWRKHDRIMAERSRLKKLLRESGTEDSDIDLGKI